MTANHIPSSILALLLAMPLIATGATPEKPKYVEPDTKRLNVDSKGLVMAEEKRGRIVAAMASYVCRGAPLTQAYLDESTKVLGLALLLDPGNREVVLANARLRANKVPTKSAKKITGKALAEKLRLGAKELLGKIGKSNTHTAGYFLMLGAELDPDNDSLVYDYEVFKQKGLPISWDALLAQRGPQKATAVRKPQPAETAGKTPVSGPRPHPAYARRPKTFARQQTKVKGLFVTTLPTGMHAGEAMEIIASIYRYHRPDVTNCRFSRPVGQEMITSWDEAINAMRIRYPNWQGGNQIQVSFSDKYSAKDGGSAGMAFALMLWSLLDNVELDPDFALTGDITVDWKIRSVGGIESKIRGATLDKCRYVAVPKANERQLADAILVSSLRQLWEIQVFLLDDLDEAMATVRVDRDAKLTKAMTNFEKVQKYLAAKGARGLRNPNVVKALNDIVELAPNHGSAAYLIKAVSGRLPRRLSVAGSVDATMSPLSPLLPHVFLGDRVRVTGRLNVPDKLIDNAHDKLSGLQTKVDGKTQGLHSAAVNYLRAVKDYNRLYGQKASRSSQHVISMKRKRLQSSAAAFKSAFEALSVDSRIVEALMRE